MKVLGLIDRNVQYEDVKAGHTRYAQNMTRTKDGRFQNEDGIQSDSENVYNVEHIGGVVAVDSDTIAVFPHGDWSEFGVFYVTIIQKGQANRTVRIANNVNRATFSSSVFKNYLTERIITYIQADGTLRAVNIDTPIPEGGAIEFNKVSKLTPDLWVPVVDSIIKIKGGSLATGRYFVAFGFEIEKDTVTKWSVPQGPYTVASFKDDAFGSHTGSANSITDYALRIRLERTSLKHGRLAVAVISDIDSVMSATIIAVLDITGTISDPAYQQVIYTGVESVRDITVDDVLVNKFHIEKAKSLTKLRDSLIVGGVEGIDTEILDSLQLVANDITVNYKVTEVPSHVYENSQGEVSNVINSANSSLRQESLMPDEVYSHYMCVQLTDGTTRQYPIPGREALAMSVDVIDEVTLNGFGTSAYEDSDVPAGIAGVYQYDGVIPDGAKLFQLFNTCELLSNDNGVTFYNTNDDDGFIPGYWENETERYPNHASFGDFSNAIVRHSRCPSFKQCYEAVGSDFAFKINPIYNMPVLPEAAKPLIASVYFACAKRSTTNSLISGMAPLIPHGSIFDDGNPYTFQFSHIDEFRLYDYNMLVNKIAPNFDYTKVVYSHNHGIMLDETLFDYTAVAFDGEVQMHDPATCRFSKVQDKKYLPKGNAAIEPPNIYEDPAGQDIINREETLYISLARSYKLEDPTKPDNGAYNKPMSLLYNWNVNLYSNVAALDTFMTTNPERDFKVKHIGSGGDVFLGVEYTYMTYIPLAPPLDRQVLKHPTLRWFGFSPILQQGRVIDYTEDEGVSDVYNKSTIPINDLYTPIKHGANLDDVDLSKLPYRFVKSEDNSTENIKLNIRQFLVNNYGEIPKYKGEITNVIGQDDTLFIQTPNTSWIYKIKDTLKTDEIDAYLGRSDLFSLLPAELISNRIAIGGNKHVNSHLIFRHGIMFPDAIGGDIFIVRDNIKALGDKGLSQDIKRYLKTADEIYMEYDDDNERVMVSIIARNPANPTMLLSYYPRIEAWVSEHTHSGVIPYSFDSELRYANVLDDAQGNRFYKHDPQASSKTLVGLNPDSLASIVASTRDAFVDVVHQTPDNRPMAIRSLYFKTICENLLDFNNRYLIDHTFDELICYTRTKCTGIVPLLRDTGHRGRDGGVLTFKDGIWRFNDIVDNIIHYVTNEALNNNVGELIDKPNFINEETGQYDPTILSSSAGGSRPTIAYYDRKTIEEGYIVLRFIMRTDKFRKIALTDVSISLLELTSNQ